MATTAHKGAISFGLVHIPVSLYTATQDNDISFNQLCREDGSRVRYKKVCGSCGKEVTSADIVKGFQYEKDKYVIVDDADFEKIKTEQDRTIKILHFADLNSIRPIYYDKSYHALPTPGGDRAYELLRQAMMMQQKVGIAKTVMGNKETLLAIIPAEDEILIETLFFSDEVKDIPKEIRKPELSDAEITMACNLISSLDKPFVPEEHHDEYQVRLRSLIEDKIAGREIVEPVATAENNIIDLMAALQASVEQVASKSTKKSPATRKRKSKTAS